VDRRLEAVGSAAHLAARGTAAVANARLAYRIYGEIFSGPEFVELRAAGARVQRPLWASTSTKNPAYPDVLYVDGLIGPDTVNTMPRETIDAFLDHGSLRRTLDADPDEAADRLAALEQLGISMVAVTDELLADGVRAFAASFDELMATIEAKRGALAGR